MEIIEQKRPLPRPHSPPKPLETESDAEGLEDYQLPDSSPLHLKNLSENSNRSKNTQNFRLSTHKCTTNSATNSMHRSSSLEHRLQGATSAVKHLEKEIKSKNQIISTLQSELSEKNRMLEAYQSQILSAQTHQKSSMLQSSLTSVIRKKEKELEKINKNQQEKIDEDKRTMIRLQELNKNLVAKVKDQEKKFEELEMSTAEKMNQYHINRNLVEENQHLAVITRKAKLESESLRQEARSWQEKYQTLLNSSMEFEFQTRELYKANQILNENILKLLENNQI
jgi:IMP dehydrogenase/GMP reductase